jgi:predicted DNA-binding transcriptional regulator YafY
MRERLLRPTLVLAVVAWMLAISFYATRGSSAMFALAIALTILTVILALSPGRRFGTVVGSRPDIDERALGLLRQAIQEKRDVSFVYAAKDGSTTSRRVTPTELFDVGETPCLAAFCHLRNGERPFVLERVGSVQLAGPAQATASAPQRLCG